jgi:hypothetical protein
MAGVKIPKVKVGQICWTTGGHVVSTLNGRLVKVTSVGRKGEIEVQLLNPTQGDICYLGKDCKLSYTSSYWLFTTPSDWKEGWMEGTPDSITQPVLEKKPITCPSCNSKVTVKMKFCGECGEKL